MADSSIKIGKIDHLVVRRLPLVSAVVPMKSIFDTDFNTEIGHA